MKRPVKKTITLATSIMLIMSLSIISFASASGYKNAPEMYATTDNNDWTSGGTTYASKTPALGSACYTYFRNYGTLQSSFSSNSSRKCYVQLMENDGIFNTLVKSYMGSFNGRTISSFTLKSTTTPGKIEGNSDNCVELFTNNQVKKMSGDPSDPWIASGLYQYDVGIN